MQIEKLSTSSISTWEQCLHKFFLSYILGIKEDSGMAACIGSAVHKIFEYIALDKMGKSQIEKRTDEEIIDYVVGKFQEDNPHLTVEKKNLNDIRTIAKRGLEYNNRQFHPRTYKNIISTEQYFSIDIDEEWGKFKLNGIIDLVTKIDDNTIEIVDYKTASQLKDFDSGKPITEDYLYKNPQIRLYNYACYKLFPQYDNVIFTIYYIRHDAPFSIIIGKEESYKVDIFLRRKYEKIVAEQEPPLNITWKCKMCDYSKKQYEDSGLSICQFFRDKVREDGLEETVKNYRIEKVKK